MITAHRTTPEIIDAKKSNQLVIPSDWWLYKINGPGITQAEKYMNPPVCKYAELYYLLFLLVLKNSYSNHQEVKKNHLIKVSAYSSDGTHNTTAYAIRKNVGLTDKVTQKYSYHLGEETYLLLTSPLAGSICVTSQWIRDNTKLTTVQTLRPLLYDQTLVTQLLEKEIKTFVSPPSPHNVDLLKLSLEMVQQYGYIESIIQIASELKLPIEQTVLISNSKLPTVNFIK